MKKKTISFVWFRQHKMVVTLCLTLLTSLLGYQIYVYELRAALDPVLMPVASHYLKAGTILTEQDIKMAEVPRPVVDKGVPIKKEQLIGMAVNTYNSVAEGSLFYQQLLIPKEQLNDVSTFPLNENEAAVSIDADIKTSYANSILPGHLIDLYFQGYASQSDEQEKKVLYGELVHQARVIAVRDGNGININAQSEKPTSVIVVALSYQQADLVQRAKFFGTVMPMITYGSLNPQEISSSFYDAEKMKDILYQRTIDVTLIEDVQEDE